MFVEAVYLLCAATSLLCAGLLLRGYLAGRTRLLLWSSLCFGCLAAENVLLFVDLVLFPDIDLRAVRFAAALIGLALLLYGFIFDLK